MGQYTYIHSPCIATFHLIMDYIFPLPSDGLVMYYCLHRLQPRSSCVYPLFIASFFSMLDIISWDFVHLSPKLMKTTAKCCHMIDSKIKLKK